MVPSGLQSAAETPETRVGVPPAMTRCECAGVGFEEIARRLSEQRISLEEACGRTGCGATCTACLPDLRAYLASR
jgi:bacterioferritin-associated ferredoxin